MILSNQRFSALVRAIQSHMVACLQAACPQQSAAALLSSSGFVSVPVRSAPAWTAFCPPIPALLCVLWLVSSYGTDSVFGGSTIQEQWWRFSLYLSVSSLEGGGCWLRAYDVQRRGLCIRASHQYCTEAMSKVGRNSSPKLTWKIISNCEVLCYNECFSDHGICLADIGRPEYICTRIRVPLVPVYRYRYWYY